ncbi:MAG: DUF6716 putative glycosyltransferase [Cyanobacteriota bacterium]|nr:DUF6716 putative glycosyltransferase [Cyanobacteriota bacterium]
MSSPILLVADSDSQLLYAEALSRFWEAGATPITINVVPRDGTPQAIVRRLEGRVRIWQRPVANLLLDPQLGEFGAVGVFLAGSKLAEFRAAYHLQAERRGWRPAPLFCGFNGVVLEQFDEAITWRLGYDLIAVNGPRDRVRLQRLLRDTPFASQRSVITGLRRQTPDRVEVPRQRRLVFAEQVAMPALEEERRRMVRLLADLAERSPHWEILIRPRVAPDEATFHEHEIHISETMRQELGALHPPNLTISYTPLAELLRTSLLFGTLSSTAFFDALDLGCRPLVMGDFGLANGYGSAVFAPSGMMRRFAALADLDQEVGGSGPDPAWLEWMGYSERFSPVDLLAELRQLQAGPAPAPPQLRHPGFVVNAADQSSNQLRLGAEVLIQQGDHQGAAALLEMALLQRPDHRNIARRLAALRARSRLWRRLLLLLSPRFRG